MAFIFKLAERASDVFVAVVCLQPDRSRDRGCQKDTPEVQLLAMDFNRHWIVNIGIAFQACCGTASLSICGALWVVWSTITTR